MYNQSDLIPTSVRNDIAWMVLEVGTPVTEAARAFQLPRMVVSDSVEGFLRDARLGLELISE